MKIISVINYKGGVGKTTLTANLAAELAYRGKRVLLLDADPQCSLTFSFLSPDEYKNDLSGDGSPGSDRTIKHWFDAIAIGDNEELPKPELSELIVPNLEVHGIVHEQGGALDIIPSHLGLINVDLSLAYMLSAHPDRVKRQFVKVHGQFRSALTGLADEANYDIALIDCPPNFNIVTKNGIVASDGILVPAKPDYLSTLGIDYLVRNLGKLVEEFNSSLPSDKGRINPVIMGVIFTMIQVYRQHPIGAQRPYMFLENVPTFKNHVRENKTIFADAPEDRVPVVLHGYSQRTHAGVVNEIESLTDEFWREVEKLP